MGPVQQVNVEVKEAKDQKLTWAAGWCVSFAAISGLLFGYNTSIVSGAMIYVKDDFGLDHVWQELLVSMTIAAAWICSMFSGSLSDRWGRKVTILISAIVFAVGSLVMGAALNKWMLLVGRLIVGAAIGFSSVVVPV